MIWPFPPFTRTDGETFPPRPYAEHVFVTWKAKSTLDGTLDVFSCHGVGGMVGMVCTVIFAGDVGLIYGKVTTLLFHLPALAIVSSFRFFGPYALYKIGGAVSLLRVTIEQEELGLHLSQHGEAVA